MPEVMEQRDLYLEAFRERENTLARREPAWLSDVRREAITAFADLGFPTTRDEEWRFTNVAPIAKVPFQTARPGSIHCAVEMIESTYWKEPVAARLVFINGHFSPQFSVYSNAALGVEVGSLGVALSNGKGSAEGWLHTYLSRSADYRRHAFTALNTAMWEDGAYVRIPKGTAVEQPIQLVFISAAGKAPLVSFPRTLVVAERDTQATVIESYLGLKGSDGISFSNSVTEIIAAENAMLDHFKLQSESERSFHVGALQVVQGRSARFRSTSVALGGALVRNEVSAVLDAEGAECVLDGLYVARGRQHVDNHTSIEHARPHGSSRQHYNGILDDDAAAVFNGRILVRPDAQKTDAIQKNRNLLLSPNTTIDTKPELQIFADDVRCTHGATIGQLDPEALFYLRSRGVGSDDARRMLVHAFAGEILDRMNAPAARAWVESALRARLSQDAR